MSSDGGGGHMSSCLLMEEDTCLLCITGGQCVDGTGTCPLRSHVPSTVEGINALSRARALYGPLTRTCPDAHPHCPLDTPPS